MVQFFKPAKKKKTQKTGKGQRLKATQSRTGTSNQSKANGDKTSTSVKIDTLDYEGKGVVRGEKVLFVEGAITGEVCQISDIQSKRGIQQARLREVLQTSEYRQSPVCSHFALCGGCQTQHIQHQWLTAQKQEAIGQSLQRQTGLAADSLPWQAPLLSEPLGYRRKSRLAIDARGNLNVGFRGVDNRVVDISECPILLPELQALLKPLKILITQLDSKHVLGHVQLFYGDGLRVDTPICESAGVSNKDTPQQNNISQAFLTFRFTQQVSAEDMAKLDEFTLRFNCRISLEFNDKQFIYLSPAEDAVQHSLVSAGYHLNIAGRESAIPIAVSSDDFVQINAVINQAMVNQALSWLELSEADRVLDLFCGVGNFSLPLAIQCQHVVGFEGVPEMVQKAQQNARLNGIDNVSFFSGDLDDERFLTRLNQQNCNKVLLDPARAGALNAIERLISLSPELILYVSCNPATFGRDIAKLVNRDYELVKLSLVDMFPNTSHSEIMGLFRLNA